MEQFAEWIHSLLIDKSFCLWNDRFIHIPCSDQPTAQNPKMFSLLWHMEEKEKLEPVNVYHFFPSKMTVIIKTAGSDQFSDELTYRCGCMLNQWVVLCISLSGCLAIPFLHVVHVKPDPVLRADASFIVKPLQCCPFKEKLLCTVSQPCSSKCSLSIAETFKGLMYF